MGGERERGVTRPEEGRVSNLSPRMIFCPFPEQLRPDGTQAASRRSYKMERTEEGIEEMHLLGAIHLRQEGGKHPRRGRKERGGQASTAGARGRPRIAPSSPVIIIPRRIERQQTTCIAPQLHRKDKRASCHKTAKWSTATHPHLSDPAVQHHQKDEAKVRLPHLQPIPPSRH